MILKPSAFAVGVPAAGEQDLERLVAVTDDTRSQLVHRALNNNAPDAVRTVAADDPRVNLRPDVTVGALPERGLMRSGTDQRRHQPPVPWQPKQLGACGPGL